MKRILTTFVAILFVCSLAALAHPGRTDSKGGHNDRKNGGYHYHNSGSSSSSKSSSSSSSSSKSSPSYSNKYASGTTPKEDTVRKVATFTDCTNELTLLNLKLNKLVKQMDEQKKEIIRLKASLRKNGIEIIGG